MARKEQDYLARMEDLCKTNQLKCETLASQHHDEKLSLERDHLRKLEDLQRDHKTKFDDLTSTTNNQLA